jgi:hypothetical protein
MCARLRRDRRAAGKKKRRGAKPSTPLGVPKSRRSRARSGRLEPLMRRAAPRYSRNWYSSGRALPVSVVQAERGHARRQIARITTTLHPPAAARCLLHREPLGPAPKAAIGADGASPLDLDCLIGRDNYGERRIISIRPAQHALLDRQRAPTHRARIDGATGLPGRVLKLLPVRRR